ncbi:MAG: kelch repeat-containing protein, partial [Anaerolineae bacterium]
ATVSGVSQAGDQFITTADDAGLYSVSVPGGLYDVTASAFGYYSGTVKAVKVVTGFMSVQDIALQPSPTGTLAGRVAEVDTGEPLTATISAIDTPSLTSTDANGYYTLTLPVGIYNVKATSHGHETQTVTGVSIASGEHQTLDFALETAPSILLVDADVWDGDSVASYYEWALDYEGYLYDTRPITDTDYLPTAAELSPYDVVIWANPWSSPGYINADEELIVYLDNGGRLLISGQDIGYWDSQYGRGRAPLFYNNYLYAKYVRDKTGINDLKGVTDDILGGVDLVLEDVYAYKKGGYLFSDEVRPADGYATSIIDYEADGSGGLKTDVCEPNPYRVVYLSFGYEGAGPRPDYAAVLDRAIQWLIAPRPLREASLRPKSQYKVGEPGTSIQYSIRMANDGQTAGAYDISLSGNAWPTAILDSWTKNPITRTKVISPCGWQDLLVQVDIPTEIQNPKPKVQSPKSEVDTVTVQATMADDASIFSTATLTTRVFPAWSYKSRLLTRRYRLAAVTVGCELYAIGGWDWTGASTVNDMYDPVADFWTTKASKPTGAANVGAAVLDDKIYVVGGMSNNLRFLSAVEVYDPATDSWSSVAPLPVGLSGTAVAAAGGKLYVFGGGSASGGVATTYEYDPAADTWTQKAPLPGGPRSYAAATALNGRIYVAGGWPDLRTFEEYDPASDTWTTKASLLRGRQSPGLVAIGGYLYAVGGGSGWSVLGTTERYYPTADTWVTVSSLNTARAGVGAAVAGGGIYVLGGVDIYSEYMLTNEALALEDSLCPTIKEVDKVTASPGQVLTYTIALNNPGNTDFVGVSLVDPIPAHTTYVTGSISGGAIHDEETNRIEWSGTVTAGASITFTFQVMLDSPLLGRTTIANVAAVNDGRGTSFTKKTATKAQAANLETSIKQVDKTAALSGEVLTYTIVLSNTGSVDAVGASLVDPLPADTTYVPDSATGGAVYTPTLNRIEWTGTVSPTVSEKTAYSWLDSDTPGGPIYHWEEASETGTEITSWTDRNNGFAGPFDIGFDFPFFGNVYSDT